MFFELTENGIALNAIVIPNSKEFSIKLDKENGCIRIKTRQKAVNGKANKEIEKNLGNIFKAKIRIVFGFHSKKKKILVETIDSKKLNLIQSLL